MQDRFKFRAKRLESNKFVYGYLCFIYNDNKKRCRIYSQDDARFYECYTETLGRCTCLKDKNRKSIYEGDIISGIYGGYISWCDECKSFELFVPEFGCTSCSGDILWQEIVEDDGKLEVIGNIHENPDFL